MQSIDSGGAAPAGAASGGTLDPALAAIAREVDSAGELARRLVEDLTDEQFNWRSEPGRWSVGECLEHLRLSGEAYLRPIDRALDDAPPGGGGTSVGVLGRLIAWSMEPPYRMKVKTFPVLVPGSALSREQVLTGFLSMHDALLVRLRRANGLDLRRARVSSPFSRALKLRLPAAFAFLAAHERRHLWQAEQVRKAPGFPPRELPRTEPPRPGS